MSSIYFCVLKQFENVSGANIWIFILCVEKLLGILLAIWLNQLEERRNYLIFFFTLQKRSVAHLK